MSQGGRKPRTWTLSGVVDSARPYEAPYTRFSAKGIEGVSGEAEVIQLIDVLDEVRLQAAA